MEFLKKNSSALLWGIIELVLGILLIVDGATDFDLIGTLVIIVGILLILAGAYSFIKYFITPAQEAKGKYLYGGLVELALGIIILIKHSWFDGLTWLVAFIFALFLLFAGFEKVQSLVDKLRTKESKGWALDLVSAVVLIALAIIILAIDNEVIKIILGVVLVLIAVYDIVVLIFLNNVHNASRKDKKANAVDVEEIEDKKD